MKTFSSPTSCELRHKGEKCKFFKGGQTNIWIGNDLKHTMNLINLRQIESEFLTIQVNIFFFSYHRVRKPIEIDGK